MSLVAIRILVLYPASYLQDTVAQQERVACDHAQRRFVQWRQPGRQRRACAGKRVVAVMHGADPHGARLCWQAAAAHVGLRGYGPRW